MYDVDVFNDVVLTKEKRCMYNDLSHEKSPVLAFGRLA